MVLGGLQKFISPRDECIDQKGHIIKTMHWLRISTTPSSSFAELSALADRTLTMHVEGQISLRTGDSQTVRVAFVTVVRDDEWALGQAYVLAQMRAYV